MFDIPKFCPYCGGKLRHKLLSEICDRCVVEIRISAHKIPKDVFCEIGDWFKK